MKGAPTAVLQDLSTPVTPRSAGWHRLYATRDTQAKVTCPSHMADQSPAPMGSAGWEADSSCPPTGFENSPAPSRQSCSRKPWFC